MLVLFLFLLFFIYEPKSSDLSDASDKKEHNRKKPKEANPRPARRAPRTAEKRMFFHAPSSKLLLFAFKSERHKLLRLLANSASFGYCM